MAFRSRHRDARSGWTAPPARDGIPAARSAATPTSTASASFDDEWLRGGPVRRWVPRAYADRPISVFETGGSTGVPKSRINIDDFRIDYEAFSDTPAGRGLPARRGLAVGRPDGAAAAAAVRRAPRPAPRRHLLHGGPRPAVGDQAPEGGPAEGGGGLQAARDRPGAHAAARPRHHPLPVHHPQAARGAVREDLAQEGRHHRRLLRGHGDDPAVPSLRGGGAAGGRGLRAHLREHAHGAGGQPPRARRGTTTRSSTTRRRRGR